MLFAALLVAAPFVSATICDDSGDVVIFGGTVCGVTAATAVHRTDPSAKVLWLVNGSRLGGMTSGGLGGVDGGSHILGGIAAELFAPFGSAVTPSFAEAAVGALLPPAVQLVKNTGWLASVETSGSPRRIQSLTTLKGKTYCGKVFVDCSYEGDLLVLSGTRSTYGRESIEAYGESLAGTDAGGFANRSATELPFNNKSIGEKQMWFSEDVSPWVDPTKNRTLLPSIVRVFEDDEIAGRADRKVMSFCFRMCLTSNATNAIAIEAPPGYTRASLELLRRELISVTKKRKLVLNMHSLFLIRSLPEDKIDLNSGQWTAEPGDGGFFPFSTDLPFAQNVGEGGWSRGDAATRASIFAAHKWWTQALLYYLGNDAELETLQPGLVKEVKAYGLCGDEYPGSLDHWTPQLYAREANRLVGAVVLTQDSVCHPRRVKASVGLSEWGVDIHAVERVAALVNGSWRVFNAGGRDTGRLKISTCPGGIVEVPYEAIIPQYVFFLLVIMTEFFIKI